VPVATAIFVVSGMMADSVSLNIQDELHHGHVLHGEQMALLVCLEWQPWAASAGLRGRTTLSSVGRLTSRQLKVALHSADGRNIGLLGHLRV
jgi:hypothetical protein